jgi:heme-degrading monooxygenase HmoA
MTDPQIVARVRSTFLAEWRRDLRGPGMITVANRLYVKAEYADALKLCSESEPGWWIKMEGFISNQILRPVNEGDPYVVFTTWNSRQDFLNGSAPTHL